VINGSVQAFLPAWVRTRGLSFYQLVLYGCTALGSVVVGAAADISGLTTTLTACGIAIVAVAGSLAVRPLADPTGMGRASVPLPMTDAPPVSAEPALAVDPVLVLVRYEVPEADRPRFLELMAPVEQSRRRTGARRWEVYSDPDDPGALIEAFTVGSWEEHLDQHADRITEFDEQLLETARACSVTPPTVRHLIGTPRIPRHGRAAPLDR